MIPLIIALTIAFLSVGIIGVGVGEAVLDERASFTTKANPQRTLMVVFWPICIVALAGILLLIGIFEGPPALYKRYLRGRSPKVNPLFMPGEAARRIACIAKARIEGGKDA